MTIALLEIGGRFILPKEYIRLIGDADHRMKPFSEKDVNEDGIRFRGNSKDVSGKNTIVFLGDSFTYGYRLRYNETIPQQFEAIYQEQKHTDLHVVNFGWISSSPVLSNRLLRDIGEKYHPKTVFLLLDMTDIWDDNLYTQLLTGSLTGIAGKYLPVTTIAIYQLINHIPPLYEKIYGQPVNRFFHSSKPLAETQHLFAHTVDAINNIDAYTRNTLHAKFVLVVLPRNYQYSDKEALESPDRHSKNLGYVDLGPYAEEPFKFFEILGEKAEFPVFLLLDDFKESKVFPTTFKDDSHYNSNGAKLAATAIYKHCAEINCLSE